ncbi:ISXO2-like domain-containing [Brachionus plicatilis]|uniref:ISXO2-like domain-containing n=1 Tax=Brachionus plicatilis TaxID=10195 RepID=A0A3M7PJL7_BRAPC|nr:ISXO2-like domain-containing [Brachionus plicatilis]
MNEYKNVNLVMNHYYTMYKTLLGLVALMDNCPWTIFLTLNKPIELYNLKEVIDLNQADILELLTFKGFVLPKTIIYSDCWRGYTKIRDLDKNFEHFTVNYNLFFVNPENGIHPLYEMDDPSPPLEPSPPLDSSPPLKPPSISRIATKDSQSCIQENENVVATD